MRLNLVISLFCIVYSSQTFAAKVAHYSFEGNVVDSVASRAAQLDGTPEFVPGKIGQALQFVQSESDGVTISNEPALFGYNWTISFWVNTTNTSGSVTVPRWSTGTMGLVTGYNFSTDWGISMGAGKVLFGIGTNPPIVSKQPVNDGQWHHIACVRDGASGRIALYVDGRYHSSSSLSVVESTSPFIYVGRTRSGIPYSFFDGRVDEVEFYNTALSETEIFRVMQPDSVKNPHPGDGHMAAESPLLLEWEPGYDGPGIITGYKLFIGSGTDRLFSDPNGYAITPDSAFLYLDEIPQDPNALYWSVSTLVDHNTDALEIPGPIWKIRGQSDAPILEGPYDPAFQLPDPLTHEYKNAVELTVTIYSSKPLERIDWYKAGTVPGEDELMTSSPSVTIDNDPDGQYSKLLFNAPQGEDSGHYYCIVMNNEGFEAASRTASVRVPFILRNRYSFEEDPEEPMQITDSIRQMHGLIIDPDNKGYASFAEGQLYFAEQNADGTSAQVYADFPAGLISSLDKNGTILIWTTWQDLNCPVSEEPKLFDFGNGNNYLRFEPRNISNGVARVSWNLLLNNAASPIAFDRETCIAIVFEDTTVISPRTKMHLYIDGRKISENIIPHTIASIDDIYVRLVRSLNDHRPYIGSYNEFRLYDIPLTGPWIAAMHKAGPDVLEVNPCIDPPHYDVNDDCIFDLSDFAASSEQWLKCGLLQCP